MNEPWRPLVPGLQTSRRFSYLLGIVVALGCQEAPPEPGEPTQSALPPLPSPSSPFDPSMCGAIVGQVTWDGPSPEVPPFKVHSSGVPNKSHLLGLVRENPNAPKVQYSNRGVHEAIVFLRGVQPATAKPWNHAPVLVRQKELRLSIIQGEEVTRTGFVRRGAAIAIVSRDPFFHCLRASGAAFFSYPFVDRNRATSRRLDRPGLVELSSGAGYYWMRAYLFVDDHPYYARTDADGRFRLDQVPAGKYTVVCWHPSWEIIRRERDPESSLVSRVFFAAPLERHQDVAVEQGKSAMVRFALRSPP